MCVHSWEVHLVACTSECRVHGTCAAITHRMAGMRLRLKQGKSKQASKENRSELEWGRMMMMLIQVPRNFNHGTFTFSCRSSICVCVCVMCDQFVLGQESRPTGVSASL
jgi:hypothetical protein